MLTVAIPKRNKLQNIIVLTPKDGEAARPGAMVQHCLPAYRGQEITEKVFEAHADEIFEEAENRLHAQEAVMVMLMKDRQ